MNYSYQSILKERFYEYERLRLKSGYSEDSLSYLRVFDAFLVENQYKDDHISKEIVDLWSVQKETENKNTRNSRVSCVKQFCLYLNAIGVYAFVPNYRFSYEKSTPYVLTEDEIKTLFIHVDNLFKTIKFHSNHYRFMIPVLIRLLYVTGLRNNEACTLKIQDLNDDATLTIHNAKNKKDRIVYLSDDMYHLLNKYIEERDKYIISEWLFPSTDKNKHISKTSIADYFHRTAINANIGTSSHYPTPHSLRHTYVVHLVDQWIKKGKKMNDLMPYLSKQLGHNTTEETYYYYHMLCSSYGVIDNKNRNLYPEVLNCETK